MVEELWQSWRISSSNDVNKRCRFGEVVQNIMERLSSIYIILLPERKYTFPLE